jgi:protocatechuate 3,4-dioxygenase beta subunit
VQAPGLPKEPGDQVVVSGLILAPDGKPCSGAKVYVSTYTVKDQADPKVRATSGSDGRFRFTATRSEVDVNETVVAVADGYGPAWVALAATDQAGGLPALRLVKDDIPISGRVLDLENRPISNATVRVVRVRKMPGEDLSPWIKDLQTAGSKSIFDPARARVLLTYERIMQPVWGVLGAPHVVRTGADGRFRLSGFGRERVVELAIEGSSVERRQVTVLTRLDPPPGLPPLTYGHRFDHLAAPAKAIAGTVREKGTGKPVAGVEVACAFVSPSGALTDLMPGGGGSATTDDQGRYRLLGTPKSKQYHLGAVGGPYFAGTQVVTDTAGLEAVTADFELERGLLIQGRLTDRATGRPVRGTLYYVPRADNPHLKAYPGFARISTSVGATEKDGSFSVAVLPGPGLFCARAIEDRFVRADVEGLSSPLPPLLQLATFHAIRKVDPTEKDAKSQACAITLDPGRTACGTVLGPDGAPLEGVFVAGLAAAYSAVHGSPPKPRLATAAFTAVGLDMSRPRTLVFWHEEKKLAKGVRVRGDEPGPLAVRLEPLGAVTGLLRDADGRPQADARVEARYSSRQDGTLPGELSPGIPGLTAAALPLPRVTTGPDGRFRLEGLIPGLRYDVFAQTAGEPFRLVADLAVSGGACKDLGEPTAKPKPGK